MGNFLTDLDRSRRAVNALMNHYEALGLEVRELTTREDQKHGDFHLVLPDRPINIEVKFDERSAKTGNLCFEMSNGSKMTGVMDTKADKIYYVVPNGDALRAYVFNTQVLRKFITDPMNVEIRNGGDKRKFILALAKITKIVEAGLPEEVFDLA